MRWRLSPDPVGVLLVSGLGDDGEDGVSLRPSSNCQLAAGSIQYPTREGATGDTSLNSQQLLYTAQL